MASKKKVKTNWYDTPKAGFRRWTTYIEQPTLDLLKGVALLTQKPLYEALNEAIKEYVDRHKRG